MIEFFSITRRKKYHFLKINVIIKTFIIKKNDHVFTEIRFNDEEEKYIYIKLDLN